MKLRHWSTAATSVRAAFTLFELILAVALSGMLLALIGTAINLYLTRVEMGRERVEEAQLARSILSMIASDLRATAVYQPQDVSSVAELMESSASFDVDSIDEERSGGVGGTSSPSGPSSVGTSGSAGTTTGGASSSSAATSSTQAGDSEMPLGVSGSVAELYVDVERLPRSDELFTTLTGFTNAPMPVMDGNAMSIASGTSWGAVPQPNVIKSIRYFIREGDRTEKSGRAATSLAPELQAYAGGLVRQEIPRAARLFAEQTGGSNILNSGQKLIAPEVIHLEFRYFDGEQILEMWDMAEAQSLPLAVEVSIWLVTADEAIKAGSSIYNKQALLNNARRYRQTVYLPMAALSQAGGSVGSASTPPMSSGSSTSGTSGSSTSGESSSSFGSGLGTQ